ncbi:hypothetical protein TeGR_g4593 [Tetraparma gracilis]|uniref:Acyltransferase n=1 Tax=Tetraparma gracilis TaxID=2962635 RepID=A0ABQ6N5N2_9STRA|nr:hypothetical protein TeGR_g4593 [Tetraparma gracilis]
MAKTEQPAARVGKPQDDFPHRPNDPLTFFLVFIWLGAVLIFVTLAFSVLLIPSRTYKLFMGSLLFILGVIPLPTRNSKNPVHVLGYKLGNRIMLAACYYFGLKIIRSGAPMPANPKGHGAIVAMEPHDILPYAIFAFAKDDLFPEFPPGVGLMTSAVFSLPWVRQIYSYCLAGSIDKKNFARNLKEGNLCVMIPGGVQEVALQQKQPPGSIALYLNKRKGFVKLALQHGSTIIPSFTFNYDGSFRTWIPEDTLGLNKKLGFLPMLYFGRGGIPLGIPNPPNRITVTVGEPISVPLIEEPTQEDIDRVHKQFVEGMVKTFEDNKVKAGYEKRTLVIL